MRHCPECEIEKRRIYVEQTKRAIEQAKRYGEAKGLTYLVIAENDRGIPWYYEPADAILAGRRAIDTVFIT